MTVARAQVPSPELRLGILGLGAASALVLPWLDKAPGVRFVAAADIRPEARKAFTRAHGLPAFDSLDSLCRHGDIDIVWIETPNHLHCEHTLEAIAHGKHVICAKPMGVTLDECERMIAAADRAGVRLLQGHSRVLDPPVMAMKRVIDSGRLGNVIQIDTWMYNDWLQRPRLPEELDTARGGGIVLRQGPHQMDIVRFIAGGEATSLRARAARRDPHFDTEGDYSVLMDFANGVSASIVLNGYGWFDVTELTWNIGTLGETVPDAGTRKPRPRRTRPLDPAEKYNAATAADTLALNRKPAGGMPFFGLTIVNCERGAIRQSPAGIYVYSAAGREEIILPPTTGRAAELIEMRDAIATGRPAFPDGRWGLATLEACLAILDSSRLGRDVTLAHQAPAPRME